MFTLKLIKKFIKILNSDASPLQMGGGFALGAIIGLTPFFSLHNLFIWVLIFLLKVNISSALLGIAFFSGIGFFIDSSADAVGYYVLAEAEFLHPLWTTLYNMPIVPFTHFNNTVVMGSFVISIILFIPIMFSMKYFVVYYRISLRQKLEKIKFIQLLKASKLYQWYSKFSS